MINLEKEILDQMTRLYLFFCLPTVVIEKGLKFEYRWTHNEAKKLHSRYAEFLSYLINQKERK